MELFGEKNRRMNETIPPLKKAPTLSLEDCSQA